MKRAIIFTSGAKAFIIDAPGGTAEAVPYPKPIMR
jgi:hypothetical protein